jgi:23S rRNA pseudouridine1911/1915/1917 synthase
MQYIGHSVIGDPVYTLKNPYNLNGQALHAKTIGFVHPVSGEYMEFSKEPPQHFENLLKKLREEI